VLEAGLVANAAIRAEAYVAPESDREAIINELIALLTARNSARRRGRRPWRWQRNSARLQRPEAAPSD
jgi:hypothetical protein